MGEGCGWGGGRQDPEGEGRAQATHCGHQVLQGPTEPHSSAETKLQVLQGGAEGSWSPGQILHRGERPLGPFTCPLGFCPLSRGQLCGKGLQATLCTLASGNLPSAHIPTSPHTPVHTHHLHACAHGMCAHPPKAPPSTHTHSWPTVTSLNFNHFAARLNTWEI